MTNEFGTSGDTGQETHSEDGTNFGQATDGDNQSETNQGMTSEELSALRQRDEHAQEHIRKLESENGELRNKVVELEDKIANATTIDDALERIRNQEIQTTSDDVEQVVRRVLEQNQTAAVMEANWSQVQGDLTNTYGDWATADKNVTARAQELGISLQDATALAKTSPKAFKELFIPSEGVAPTSGSIRSGGEGQSAPLTTSGSLDDRKAYYSKLRRENPNKYWSVDVQAEMRRELFNH